MSRTRQSPMDRAVSAFAELSPDEQSTFLLAARFAGKMTVEPPAPRKRKARNEYTESIGTRGLTEEQKRSLAKRIDDERKTKEVPTNA